MGPPPTHHRVMVIQKSARLTPILKVRSKVHALVVIVKKYSCINGVGGRIQFIYKMKRIVQLDMQKIELEMQR